MVRRGHRSRRSRPEHQASKDSRLEDPPEAFNEQLLLLQEAGVASPPIESAQYTALRYTERLAEVGAIASIGTVGDSYDNALADLLGSCC